MTEKRCSKCHAWKPSSDFHRDNGRADGLRAACKACLIEQRCVYLTVNAERLRAQRAATYPDKKGYFQETNRITKQRDPLGNRMRTNRTKAKKLGASGNFTRTEWLALVERYDHRCLCCGEQEPAIELSFDHVLPLGRGGSNDIGNIQPLCLTCNQRKQTGTTDYRQSSAVAAPRRYCVYNAATGLFDVIEGGAVVGTAKTYLQLEATNHG